MLRRNRDRRRPSSRSVECRLRKQVRRELRGLNITPPLRVDVLCERLGERRGRPIKLVEWPLEVPGPSPFGLWLPIGDTDYILVQKHTSRVHQDHIIIHELAHILAGTGSDEHDAEVWEQLHDFDPETIRRRFRDEHRPTDDRRTDYEPPHEWRVELVATIVREWASVVDYTTPRELSDDPVVRRLQDALGDRQGWL